MRERLGNRVGREEMLARQHLVQHDAERPDVCAAIDGFATIVSVRLAAT
jgi:hypothetical protein